MKQLQNSLIVIFILATIAGHAQLKVGDNPTTINSSAVLEAESTNKGFLPPRIALTSATDVTTISSPATGLLIYNTATAGTSPNIVTPGYYFYNGSSWSPINSTYSPGQVIKITMLPYSSIGQGATTTVGSTVPTYTQIASYSYTPVSSSSTIIVEYNTMYAVGGTNGDNWRSRIMINGSSQITNGFQQWADASGGGTRGGTLFPLMGSYTNSSTSAITISIQAARNSSDDNTTFYGDSGTWLKITEIAR